MEVLKNRMQNGTPFLREAALARIAWLADNLEITQEEADELTAIAEKNGCDKLPGDILGRLETLEAKTLTLESAVQELSLSTPNTPPYDKPPKPSVKPGGGLTIGG